MASQAKQLGLKQTRQKVLSLTKCESGFCITTDKGQDTFDAVIIATPHYDHTVYGIACMERGIHVMVEKPAGVYTLQVEEMLERAKKSDKILGIMFNQRTNPAFKMMKKMILLNQKQNILRRYFLIYIRN